MGLPAPGGALLLFPRRKSNQKGAQGARPLENPECFVYLPSAAAGLFLPMVLTLRLPLPSFYPRVLTGGEAAGGVPAVLRRSDSEGPRCRVYPFKRPAGVQWPTATSNPKPPVAAHGRSPSSTRPLDQNPEGDSCSRGTAALHLQSVSEKPPPRQAVPLGRPRAKESRTMGSGAFLGTFCAHKKYPRGVGPGRPRKAINSE